MVFRSGILVPGKQPLCASLEKLFILISLPKWWGRIMFESFKIHHAAEQILHSMQTDFGMNKDSLGVAGTVLKSEAMQNQVRALKKTEGVSITEAFCVVIETLLSQPNEETADGLKRIYCVMLAAAARVNGTLDTSVAPIDHIRQLYAMHGLGDVPE